MKAKEFVPQSKPRNFVAKNAMKTTSGAGAHRDKKKEQKQGYEKHKGNVGEDIDEGWKDKVAAAALAGSMALGAGGAKADTPSEPTAASVKAEPLSSRYTPGIKYPEPYTIEYQGNSYKFAGRVESAPKGGEEVKVPAALIGIRGLGAVTVTLGKDGKYYVGSAN